MAAVLVVDLSRLLPGPFATLCLQGLGHEVVKVEDPNGGDYLRHMPPQLTFGDRQHGAWFAALNRGKKSVTLDLRTEPDRALLFRLLERADVLLESFRPGVMARLGLAAPSLLERFPRLVVASLTGWGQDGPLAALPGHDIGFLSLAGMFGHATPSVPRVQWADLAAGGLLAALRVVDAVAKGGGRWLDIAMLDGLVGLQQTQFAQLAAGAPPDGMLTGQLPIYNLYRCADGGYVSVGALEARFMEPLAHAAGDLSAESLSRLFLGAPRDAWMARLGEACVVPVLRPEEVAAHPQVANRGLFDAAGLAHPPTGRVEGAVPGLGEHQAEVFPG